MSDCPTGPTNFDTTARVSTLKTICGKLQTWLLARLSTTNFSDPRSENHKNPSYVLGFYYFLFLHHLHTFQNTKIKPNDLPAARSAKRVRMGEGVIKDVPERLRCTSEIYRLKVYTNYMDSQAFISKCAL